MLVLSRIVVPAAFGLAVLYGGAATAAELPVWLYNPLDCQYDARTDSTVCPKVASETPAADVSQAPGAAPLQSGRAATSAASAQDRQAYCARTYKSYDPKTGKYRAFSGALRDCN
jgi:hypothetical protein